MQHGEIGSAELKGREKIEGDEACDFFVLVSRFSGRVGRCAATRQRRTLNSGWQKVVCDDPALAVVAADSSATCTTVSDTVSLVQQMCTRIPPRPQPLAPAEVATRCVSESPKAREILPSSRDRDSESVHDEGLSISPQSSTHSVSSAVEERLAIIICFEEAARRAEIFDEEVDDIREVREEYQLWVNAARSAARHRVAPSVVQQHMRVQQRNPPRDIAVVRPSRLGPGR